MKQYQARQMIGKDENINIYAYHAQNNESDHTHDFLEIVYILSGSGQHAVGGKVYRVRRGNLLFINIGQTHAFSSTGDMELVNCLIDPAFIGQELIHAENALEILALSAFEDFSLPADKLIPMVRFGGGEMLAVEKILISMIDEFSQKQVNYKTALKGYLLVLLTKIFRAMQQNDSAGILNQVNRIMPDILHDIEINYAQKISLPELAQKCFYNPSYFSKVFKDYCGQSLTEFVTAKRIGEAARLLRETNLSVEDIGARVGYHDRKQFSEVYRKCMGIPPSAERKPAGPKS
ncbi:MAG: AraC family transcriptional regulator [Clostridiaceae bacterium]|nr:AraC family transcriptional regulator [Clostridiaceae bacterium]